MLRAQRLLEDGQGLLVRGPRRRVVPLGSQQEAQVVEREGGVGVPGAQRLLADGQPRARVL